MTITNLDPKPYVTTTALGSRRWNADDREHAAEQHDDAGLEDEGDYVVRYDPRPEFDVGDNPILQAVSDFEFPADELASLDLARGGDDRWFWLSQGATPEQIDHARTVLELIKKEQSA